eukprot:TRINITY_DN1342_c0_g2_i2.p1 TRINITY_DN1342_c0_g2~~TRINITY_DN1342_c0_g2_i2.p1  ORF type:complete len:223 (-),score=50.44 TRINITY_DN1342_c0_g2_i2:27-695(-)
MQSTLSTKLETKNTKKFQITQSRNKKRSRKRKKHNKKKANEFEPYKENKKRKDIPAGKRAAAMVDLVKLLGEDEASASRFNVGKGFKKRVVFDDDHVFETLHTDFAVKSIKEDIHLVVSCGCTDYQHWQAEVQLQSWVRLHHPGQITRLISGCRTEEERESMTKTSVTSGRVNFFFTPEFSPPKSAVVQSGNKPYWFLNKPNSVNDWLSFVKVHESVIWPLV